MTDARGYLSPVPFLVRVAQGEIVDVHASLIAVSHVNDVSPTGAERAIDSVLGGAIRRRAASLRAPFGTSHFLPTLASPIAAGAVLVVSLGDAENFDARRIGEIGVAIVEAAATARARDVATVVHSAGAVGVEPGEAAARLVTGVLEATQRIEGGDLLRELMIVEHDEENLKAIVAGVQRAAAPPRVHVYVQKLEAERRIQTIDTGDGVLPKHLRLGITRAGPDLKVTRIGDDAFDRALVFPFPEDVATRIPGRLAEGVLDEQDPSRRAGVLESIGGQLYRAFLGATDLGARELIQHAPGGLVVLRVDGWTVDLPWELLHTGQEFVGLERRFARQLEIRGAGRQPALSRAADQLRVLVIGNPTDDLPAAADEGRAVAQLLDARVDAEVHSLIGSTTYGDVSAALDSEDFDVLHYAGHAAFVEGRPDASGLKLADYLFTAEDLATRAHLPRLVVMNACHSAVTGKPFDGNQETRTLVAGLLGSGVGAFIGAMWEVGDEAAATFSSAFYDAIAPSGAGSQPVGEAVRLGRRAIIDEHGEDDASWAAYALYGSPWRSLL